MTPRLISASLFVTLVAGATHVSAAAQVTLGSDSYTIDSVVCDGGPGSFRIQAQATTGAELLQLGAFDGEVKSVGFRVGDTMAQVVDQTGSFDGRTFRYDGEAQVYTANSFNRKRLSVTATCPNG